MGRPGITSAQVHEAADALLAEGLTPTVVSIRTRLGGGSPNNITKWLSQWREARNELESEGTPALPPSVETAMRGVWVAAWKAAKAHLEGEREALAKARQAIEQERAEMLTEINRLDDALDTTRAELQRIQDELAAERREHEGTRADVKEARAIASERKARIEQQAVELQEAQRQAAEAAARASRADALAAERDRALAERTRLATDLKREQETARQGKAALDAGACKIRKLEEMLEAERAARQAIERTLADLRVENATLGERAARTDELRALIEQLQRVQPNGRI